MRDPAPGARDTAAAFCFVTNAPARGGPLRARPAYLRCPVLMGGFVAFTAWGLLRGTDPASLGVVLTVANSFVISMPRAT